MNKIFRNKKLLVVVVLLAFIIVIAVIFLFKQNAHYSEPEENQDISIASSPVTLDEMAKTKYVGKFVTASLPKEWTIKEIEVADTNQLLTENVDYSGLIRLELYYKDKIAFDLKAVDGIGIMDVCNTVYSFQDTDTNYIEKRKQDFIGYSKAGDEQKLESEILKDFKVKDLRDYTSFPFLDKEVRRVGYNLYWKSNSDPKFFNPECGPYSSFLRFNEITFTRSVVLAGIEQKEDLHLYSPNEITSDLSEESLKDLDSILASIYPISQKVQTYTSANLPGLSLQYPSSWTIEVKEFTDKDSKGFKSEYFGDNACDKNCMGIKLSNDGVALNIIFDLVYDIFGQKCSNSTDYEDIGSGWIRVKSTGEHFYSKSHQLNLTTSIDQSFTFGSIEDEWSALDNTLYELCLTGSGYLRAQKTNLPGLVGEPGTLVEYPLIDGNPSKELLSEMDEIIKTLN